MLLSVSLEHYPKTGLLVGVLKKDTGAAQPVPLTTPHAQTETGSTMQFAKIWTAGDTLEKGLQWLQGCDQTAAEVTHRAQQCLDSVILELSDCRGHFQS